MSLSPLNRSTLKVSALCTKWLILLRHWNGWTVQTSAWLAGQNQCDCRIKHANKQQRVNVRDERVVYIYIYICVCVCVSMVEPVKRLYRLQCRGGNYVASLDSNQAIFPFIKRQNLSLSLIIIKTVTHRQRVKLQFWSLHDFPRKTNQIKTPFQIKLHLFSSFKEQFQSLQAWCHRVQ